MENAHTSLLFISHWSGLIGQPHTDDAQGNGSRGPWVGCCLPVECHAIERGL